MSRQNPNPEKRIIFCQVFNYLKKCVLIPNNSIKSKEMKVRLKVP